MRGSVMDEFGYIPGKHHSTYEARMINTHPGPLPETIDEYGVHASQKVLDLGLTVSRHTVHVVAPRVDEGPVFVEHEIPIYPDDTAESLNQRTQLVEKATIPYAIDSFIYPRKEMSPGPDF